MSGKHLEVQELNQRRRTAVRLRLQGRMLNEIRATTGLSAPTIIAAYKAYERGGWGSVDVLRRGRAIGSGRALTKEDMDELLAAMQDSTPAEHGLAGQVWQASSLHSLLEQRLDRSLSPRTVDRYLERWSWPDPQSAFRQDQRAEIQRWLTTEYVRLTQHRRAEGGEIYWVARSESEAGELLIARNRRGALYWGGAASGLSNAETWNEFAQRLQRTVAHKVWLILSPEESKEGLLNSHRIEWVAPQSEASPRSEGSPGTTHAERILRPGLDGPMTHLDRLEAESIHIMREVMAEAENPVMLYSIGKDSSVMLHLALKAFHPAPLPFPLLHVDTRWKFKEMYKFRDQRAKDIGAKLITHINPDGVAQDVNPFTHGSAVHTDIMKTQGLKQALDKYGFDAAFGGARRDEEKARAKERIFSFRSAGHRWDPKNQRPELWRLYNGRKRPGETLRVFPLSNWTELDIWLYIHRENIPIVPLYFSAQRPVVERDGMLFMVDDERMPLREGERPEMRQVRFRTLGCYPLTAAFESDATTLTDIIEEMLVATTSERQGRVIDFDGAGSMEKKKQEGYF